MAEDFAELLNSIRDGWNGAMGLRLVRATADEVVAELTVGPQHLQGYGIVHGGVHAGAIETVASIGAALHALPRGFSVVGLENHTSFLHAVREGTLKIEARPLTRGRRSQLWEGSVTDASGRLIAKGTVRLLCLEGDVELAGAKVENRLRGG
ncbi:MAG: PaaI family thioesterase [Myxococcales bacterium]